MRNRGTNAKTWAGLLCGMALLLVLGCAGSDIDQHKDNPMMPDVVGKWTINCTPLAADCPTLRVNIKADHTLEFSDDASASGGNWQIRDDNSFVMAEFTVTLGGKSGVGAFWGSVIPGSMTGTLERCSSVSDCDKRTASGIRGWRKIR